MPKQQAFGLAILSALLFFFSSSAAYSQTGKPAVKLKVDTENFAIEDGHKNYLSSFNLYTAINRRRYFIARLAHRMVSIPEPLIDPSANFVFYASNTGCGFEGEGMTNFVSDVYGKKKTPILGRCRYLRPTGFLQAQGKNYLLITSESESPETDFWLYDISKEAFVLHADGEIKEIGKGLFSYGQNDDEGNFKPVGKITMDTLINRGAPLKLLSRYPTHGLTQKRSVPIFESDSCYSVDEKPSRTIPSANTRVLIIMECEDGGFEIYHNRYKGKVRKCALRAIEFGTRK